MALHPITSSTRGSRVPRPGSTSNSGAVVASLLALVAAVAPTDVPAHEVGAGGSGSGIVIHGAEKTLREFCRTDAGGTLWLELPGGPRFELITSIDDPAVSNRGDGAFHPFDEAEVLAALATQRFPLAGVHADVYLLPYPRRGGLESAAGPGLILLAPGVRPLAPEIQHSQVVHELGHVVQYRLMPDRDASSWQTYRGLRGIESPIYSAAGAHANRPHEIFAEDFRALFGGALANYSGTIENPGLRPPAEVQGLERFMLGLAGAAIEATDPITLAAWPVPARGAVRFASRGTTAAALDLFDAAGRRVAELEPRVAGSVVEWSWNGRDASGRTPPPGVLFARVRGDGRAATRFSFAP
jgi:hypothetical protein